MVNNPRNRLQFGLGALLGVMMLVCILTAVLAGLLRAGGDPSTMFVYVLLAVAAPIGLMLIISAWHAVHKLHTRKRRKRETRDD